MFYVVEAIYRKNSNGKQSLYSARVVNTCGYFKVAARKADAMSAASKIDGMEYLAMSPSGYEAWSQGKTREVRNLMSGEVVRESVTTPYSCSVSSEAYWSM